ncbi:Papain family cysteine protease [Planctomycetes bacterium Pan216]|uniref:Papain family cysteine protease n=1 Tax=Kolteria novifilia TaxID=2527975 RepID=A0A518AXW8_9BACT|nr:Papain family cysteine protease [Planctomycetes bacterium Pan216]
MDIAQVSDLSSYQAKLQALGFSGEHSLEQLLGAARAARPEMASYLGVSVSALATTLNNVAGSSSSIPQAMATAISHATYSLGVAIDFIPQPRSAPALAAAPTSSVPEVNLIPEMPPIRDQASRGTCVAHAALAAYEHFLETQGAYQDLSEQFLYWNCKRNDGIPHEEGTWLQVAVPLLHRDGCCLDTTWPYHPSPIPGNEGQGPPPGGAQIEALNFRPYGYQQLSSTSVDDIKNELAQGRCVAFSVPVFNSWLGSQWVAYSGDITMPVPGEIRVGGHAMCFVGYKDLPGAGLGGGRFLLRNSWGSNWGINSPHGVGYGTIPYAYIAKMGAEAYAIS